MVSPLSLLGLCRFAPLPVTAAALVASFAGVKLRNVPAFFGSAQNVVSPNSKDTCGRRTAHSMVRPVLCDSVLFAGTAEQKRTREAQRRALCADDLVPETFRPKMEDEQSRPSQPPKRTGENSFSVRARWHKVGLLVVVVALALALAAALSSSPVSSSRRTRPLASQLGCSLCLCLCLCVTGA